LPADRDLASEDIGNADPQRSCSRACFFFSISSRRSACPKRNSRWGSAIYGDGAQEQRSALGLGAMKDVREGERSGAETSADGISRIEEVGHGRI